MSRFRSALVGATGGALLVLAAVLLLATPASAGPDRALATLDLHGELRGKWIFVDCPGKPPDIYECIRFTGEGVVPGLGHVTEDYMTIGPLDDADVADDDPDCDTMAFMPGATITVARKGDIYVSLTKTTCTNGPTTKATVNVQITGGTGSYANASGGGTVALRINQIEGTFGGLMTDTWTGSLSVPGLVFDTTPPSLTGAKPKTVWARPGARRARVTYHVRATDAVDGSRPVRCTPESGSRFKIGRTMVRCSATDLSGNTATARFTVTVRRARR